MKFKAISVKHAISQISTSKIFLPPIQRSFVWDRDRIVNLFDSLYRDYPIGNCIFWNIRPETSKSYPLYLFTREFSENKKAKLPNEHAPTNLLEDDVFAVVDGQQRLSSLYIGLAGSYKYKKSGKGLQNVDANFITSKLHINLFAQDTKGAEESLFQFLSHDDGAAISEKSLWFEIGHALAWGNVDHARAYVSNFLLPRVLASKKKKLIAIFESRKEKIALKLESVYQMLHAKRLFYFDIDNQNLDEVVDVFTRVNSGGMTLKKSDLLFSILVSQWNEGRDEIGDLVESMRDSGIDISQDFVMRSCIVLSGLRVKYNLESFKTKNIKIMKGNWEDIKVSLMKLCDLLPEIGYIYHPNLSDNALIPIAYYIFKGGNLNTIKAKKSLQQYYVVSQVKGIFGGQSDQVLEKFRTEIDRQLERDKFLNIKELVALKLPGGKSMTMALEDLNQLVDDTAWGSPHAYFLLSLIYPTVDFKIKRYEIDHVHPKSKFNVRNLSNNGIADQETIDDWMDWKKDCLPNLQLLADKDNAAKKAKTLIEYLNAKKPQERHLFSKENLLPPKGDKLLELASFDQFFEYRKRKLVNKLKPSFGL